MKAVCLALLGSVLILLGGGVTLLTLLSGFRAGVWAIGHGYPILIVSIPLLIVGILLIRFLKRTNLKG